VRWTEVTVQHTGYTDPALQERKLQGDWKILEAELAERPGDLFVLFNLNAIAVERQDWSSALGHPRRSVRGSVPTDSIARQFFALLARCQQMLGDIPAALRACIYVALFEFRPEGSPGRCPGLRCISPFGALQKRNIKSAPMVCGSTPTTPS
jgi:hypothetical protein